MRRDCNPAASSARNRCRGTALALIAFVESRVAARNARWACVGALAVAASVARAQENPALVLPLTSAVALCAAEEQPARETTVVPRSLPTLAPTAPIDAPRRPLSLLPPQLRIPDGYVQDLLPGAPPSAKPIENAQFVSFDLLSQRRRGWMASLIYDQEDGRFRRPSPLVRVTLEIRF